MALSTNLTQSSSVHECLFHFWSKESHCHFAVWLCVFLIIYFKPVKGLNGQLMKNYYNDYYIFLQKEWCHKKWFIQAFCRRSLSPFFLSRGEGAATRNKCSLLTDKMITKCQISLIVRNPAWKFHEKKKTVQSETLQFFICSIQCHSNKTRLPTFLSHCLYKL